MERLSLAATTTEPMLSSPQAETTEPTTEPMLCNKRSHSNEKPMHSDEQQPQPAATRETCTKQRRPSTTKNKNKLKKKESPIIVTCLL